MKTKPTQSKLKTAKPVIQHKKKLRSKLPRRRRPQISPVLYSSMTSIHNAKTTASSSVSYFFGEVTCDSSRVSVGSDGVNSTQPKSRQRKREYGDIKGSGDREFQRVTRTYQRRKEAERKGVRDEEVEVSESSCVESCSGVDIRAPGDRGLKLKGISGEGGEIKKEFRRNEESEVLTRSNVSCAHQFSPHSTRKSGEFSGKYLNSGDEMVKGFDNIPDFNGIEVVSITSGEDSPSEVKLQNASSSFGTLLSNNAIECCENKALEPEFSEISRNYIDAKFTVSNSESTTEKKPKLFGIGCDLACTEQLSYGNVLDSSSSHENSSSGQQWEVYPENSDFSDYTPSVFFDSGSDFSERSIGDSSPSPTFMVFLQYSRQFSRATSPSDTRVSTYSEDESQDEFVDWLTLEDEEDEESYNRFRSRERRQVYLRDYAKEYCTTTEYGDLIIRQRSLMVQWIDEQCGRKELQKETMFLGVSLLDRFLSKGFFKNKRNLQVVGIACLTLATRIEENQPFNSVKQRTFYVGSNVYSRCEVVAMEWLVQEVLNFQCFLPTIYNFLWFYLKAARANTETEKMAKHLALLAQLRLEQLCYWPSTVAAAVVTLACVKVNRDESYIRVMETHVRTHDDDKLPNCMQTLQWLMQYVE